MRTTLAYTLLIFVLLSSATACGGAETGDTATGADAALEYEGPIATTADPAAGQLVYQNMCASCHAPGGAGPDLTTESLSPAQARQQVREGDDGMPAFPEARISATDLENLLAHLATMGTVTGAGGPAVAGSTSGGEMGEMGAGDMGSDPASDDPGAAPAEEAGADPAL